MLGTVAKTRLSVRSRIQIVSVVLPGFLTTAEMSYLLSFGFKNQPSLSDVALTVRSFPWPMMVLLLLVVLSLSFIVGQAARSAAFAVNDLLVKLLPGKRDRDDRMRGKVLKERPELDSVAILESVGVWEPASSSVGEQPASGGRIAKHYFGRLKTLFELLDLSHPLDALELEINAILASVVPTLLLAVCASRSSLDSISKIVIAIGSILASAFAIYRASQLQDGEREKSLTLLLDYGPYLPHLLAKRGLGSAPVGGVASTSGVGD